MPSTPCPPSTPAPSRPSLPDAVLLNDGSLAFPCPSSLGLRPTKPSPNFHFSHPQNRRSPAKHWRSSLNCPRKKSPSQFKPAHTTTSHPLARPGSPLQSPASDRQNHHQTVTFHTPKIDDLPQNTGDRRQNAAERKVSASRPNPAASAPLRPQTSVQPRLSQTALCRTNPNKPERSEQPILGQTLAITLRPTANGVFP